MAATVLYANTNELATLTQTFLVSGVPTDPSTVTLIVTDPLGNQTTYTYSPGTITRLGTGQYTQNVACTADGLWSYVWIGTGTATDATPGTFRVFPIPLGVQYAGAEELKDRLGITDTLTDFQVAVALQSASRWVERHCQRHFYQVSATRTYVPYSIYDLPVDDLVSVTQLNVDMDGDGIYETPWTSSQYQLSIGDDDFIPAAVGEPRPYTMIRVTQTGQFFPFVWPFSHLDRIQIIGLFGWPAVPAAVMEATVMIAAELFKLKDTPFGLAGAGGEYGLVAVKGFSPVAIELLSRYRSPRRAVGM